MVEVVRARGTDPTLDGSSLWRQENEDMQQRFCQSLSGEQRAGFLYRERPAEAPFPSESMPLSGPREALSHGPCGTSWSLTGSSKLCASSPVSLAGVPGVCPPHFGRSSSPGGGSPLGKEPRQFLS